MKWIKRVLQLLVLWVAVHCSIAAIVGLRSFDGKADVAIVLGNEVYKDGTLSPWLRGRVDAALHLYNNHQVKKIFVSGGIGDSGYPEGDAMRNYLIQQGVPVADIITDNLGNNSYLTAKNFVEANQQLKYESAVAVSSWFHVLRCKYILQKLGVKKVYGDHSRSYFGKDILYLLREFPAYYKYMLVY
ncbi:YdcF family protein [Pseudoflavitalea sp. G-6-1-2]|uniref:YdcF family protein n=1 Tax=Pseudoflavitalea sp. G-6-1-2 TaxID=2728841 RepID=UPI001469E508|nr:YdcF family protein [Pseudoflavitalea sp. G-6-1-2]NML21776.1 YdcF family protein [Pseudoflavitalea sp. G-6-1-2]